MALRFNPLSGQFDLIGISEAGSISIPSGQSLILYNTADQTTNYEKAVFRYSSNVLEVGHVYGGTGNSRVARFGTASTNGGTLNRYIQFQSSTPIVSYNWGGTVLTGQMINIGSGNSWTASSGNQTALGIDPTVNQSSTAGYTALLVNPTETATGSGTKLLADFQVGGTSKTRIDNTGSHYLSNGASIIDFNTTDETTNYERAMHYWNSNVYTIATQTGGSGSSRQLQITANNVSLTLRPGGASGVGLYQFNSGTSVSGGHGVRATGTFSANSSLNVAFSVEPTMNQSSTAGYTGLLVNVTETATGSGSKLLADFQVGGTSKFKISNTGKITTSGNVINVATAKTPSSASDTGTTGDIAWDTNYVYVCTATNTWKRSALSTW